MKRPYRQKKFLLATNQELKIWVLKKPKWKLRTQKPIHLKQKPRKPSPMRTVGFWIQKILLYCSYLSYVNYHLNKKLGDNHHVTKNNHNILYRISNVF